MTEQPFQAPFILKLSFYKPSKVNRAKNSAHIKYIGTRPGVELGGEEDFLETEAPDLAPDSAAGHVKYAHERPGSHGLFSATGENPSVESIQQDLQQHQGVVWRMILSLREEDARRLDFDSRSKWEDALRASVPEAARHMGIGESNLRWVAAFHQEQGHPHVHLVMWEKHPQRERGSLSKGERIAVKRTFMKEIYADERTRLLQEKTILRDLLRDVAKADSEKAVTVLRDVRHYGSEVDLELKAIGVGKNSIAPRAIPDEIHALAKHLNELAKEMPGKGRAALKFMPENVKERARQIADHLLHRPEFRESLERYLHSVEEMTRLHTFHPDKIQQARENAYQDLRNRVANVIVRAGAKINREGYLRELQEKQAAQQTLSAANSVWKSVWKAIEQSAAETAARGEMQRRQLERQQQEQADRER